MLNTFTRALLTITIYCLSMCSNAHYQNHFYGEFAGPGVLYSLNYEHFWTKQSATRVGFSYIELPSVKYENGKLISTDIGLALFPMTFSYLIGKSSAKLEVAAVSPLHIVLSLFAQLSYHLR